MILYTLALKPINLVTTLIGRRQARLKGGLYIILSRNFVRLQIFTFFIITSLSIKEVFRSGFGFEIPIRDISVLLWFAFVYLFKLSGNISIILALVLMSIIPVPMLFGSFRLADQVSVSAYLVLILGVLQLFSEVGKSGVSKEA